MRRAALTMVTFNLPTKIRQFVYSFDYGSAKLVFGSHDTKPRFLAVDRKVFLVSRQVKEEAEEAL